MNANFGIFSGFQNIVKLNVASFRLIFTVSHYSLFFSHPFAICDLPKIKAVNFMATLYHEF